MTVARAHPSELVLQDQEKICQNHIVGATNLYIFMNTILFTNIRIKTADSVSLGATLFNPTGDCKGTVLIAPATGVCRRVYQDYAGYLSTQGFNVITWDWRGIGDSRPRSLKGYQATMSDWGKLDLAAVINWTLQNTPGPLMAVGHSFGGHGIGLAENRFHLQRLITIGVQSGYWGLWPFPQRYKFALLWYLLMPLMTRIFGYFPSRMFRLAEDLPAGVAFEWSRWCRSPDYIAHYAGYQSFKAPVLSLNFTDDRYAPAAAVKWLHQRYGSPKKIIRFFNPAQLGVSRVGHFGFFKKGLTPSLWDETAEWFLSKQD